MLFPLQQYAKEYTVWEFFELKIFSSSTFTEVGTVSFMGVFGTEPLTTFTESCAEAIVMGITAIATKNTIL